MFKFIGLVLLSALAAVGAERVNVNGAVDYLMETLNNHTRQQGTMLAPFPEIPLSPKVKYSGASFLGYDSIKRTEDCWQEKEGQDVKVDIYYGFQLMTIVLPHLEVDGKNMSAEARIRDNSFHISYTLHPGSEKCITLNEYRVEKLGNVEFGASRPEYDNANLEGFFKLVVKPTLNGIVDSYFDKIEASLQKLCKVQDLLNNQQVQELVRSLL